MKNLENWTIGAFTLKIDYKETKARKIVKNNWGGKWNPETKTWTIEVKTQRDLDAIKNGVLQEFVVNAPLLEEKAETEVEKSDESKTKKIDASATQSARKDIVKFTATTKQKTPNHILHSEFNYHEAFERYGFDFAEEGI